MKNKLNKNINQYTSEQIDTLAKCEVTKQLIFNGFNVNDISDRRTKILEISDPNTGAFIQRLEIKIKKVDSHNKVIKTNIYGKIHCSWYMNIKHETIKDPTLSYCFVAYDSNFKYQFYIVPSYKAAAYIYEQHRYWLKNNENGNDTGDRDFRLGLKNENYKIPFPINETYKNNWKFNS